MYHSGIGGGGFAVVRDSEGSYEVVDFRESAPNAATQDMFNHDVEASISGGLAVAVPGELKGLEYMHNKYGVSDLYLPLLRWRFGIAGSWHFTAPLVFALGAGRHACLTSCQARRHC